MLPRRWKLACFPQESSTFRPFHAPKRPSSFSSAAAAAAYDFSYGAPTPGNNRLEGDAAAFGDRDQRWVSPSFSSSLYHSDKVQGEAVVGGGGGCVGVRRDGDGGGEPGGSSSRSVYNSSTLSLLVKCHALARCGEVVKLKEELRMLVAKEGSGSASSICELLSYFRGGEQAVLLWDVLVDVYASLEMPHDAFFALSKMNNQGMQASIFTYNSLMHSLRNTDAVWDLYGVVQAEGLPCSDCMYNVLISHLFNQGRLQDAVSFFEDKRGTGVLTPCIVTFNILIAGCCRLGFNHGSTGLI